MKTNHWIVVTMMLGAIALQLSGIDHWAEATSTKFVSGILLSIVSMLTAMFTDKVGARSTADIVKLNRGEP